MKRLFYIFIVAQLCCSFAFAHQQSTFSYTSDLSEGNELNSDMAYAVWCEGNSTLYFLASKVSLSAGEVYDGQKITAVWYGPDVTTLEEDTPKWIPVIHERLTHVVF